MAYASVNDLEELKTNPYYLKYWNKKQNIKEKYSEDIFPCYSVGKGFSVRRGTEEQREQYKKYLKEIGDLLFEPNGSYQKFVWEELTPPGEREEMERRARGRKPRTIEY